MHDAAAAALPHVFLDSGQGTIWSEAVAVATARLRALPRLRILN